MRELWSGFLKGIGAFVGAVVAGWLALRLPLVGHWAAARFADLEGLCRAAPTTLLIGVPLFLLVVCFSFAMRILRLSSKLSGQSVDLKKLDPEQQKIADALAQLNRHN